jgi:hypothetical protein
VPRPPQLLSVQGEKVIIAGLAAGLLSVLTLGFAILSAPAVAALLPLPLALLCLFAVRDDFLHVRRNGWGERGGDDSGGDTRPGPREPGPPGPPEDGERFDWDAFTTQFRDHVERQPVASR